MLGTPHSAGRQIDGGQIRARVERASATGSVLATLCIQHFAQFVGQRGGRERVTAEGQDWQFEVPDSCGFEGGVR